MMDQSTPVPQIADQDPCLVSLAPASCSTPLLSQQVVLRRHIEGIPDAPPTDGADLEVDPLVAESEVIGGGTKNCEEKRLELDGLSIRISVPATLSKIDRTG